MSDEMRLSDLVSGYSRYYAIDIPEAAHALHELIKQLFQEYGERQGKVALPGHVFWVGRAGSSRRSIRKYKLFFEGLLSYLDGLYDPVPTEGFDLIRSYCECDKDAKDIPVNLIYVSRQAMVEWIKGAKVEVPEYMLSNKLDSDVEVGADEGALKVKELGSIALIISGLVDLIKEVDRAHAEQPVDDKAARRAEAIKRRAAGLRSSRKNLDVCSAILALAEATETDMPKSHKTLKKYMTANFFNGTEESV